MSDGNISIEESASMMNDVWVSGQLSRHGIEKFVIPCRQESQTVEKSSERKKQNLETGVRQRQELNQRVMKFFRDDWVPEEIMSREEVKWNPYKIPFKQSPRKPRPSVVIWVGHKLYALFNAIVLGN